MPSPADLLVDDLLAHIMLQLPSSIAQKFALAQVSRLWRAIALANPLLWASCSGRASEKDCLRFPLVLQRSGPHATLHIQLRFTGARNKWWAETMLAALVPYAARIETLQVDFEDTTLKSILGSDAGDDEDSDSGDEESDDEDSESDSDPDGEESDDTGESEDTDSADSDDDELSFAALLQSNVEFTALQTLRLEGAGKIALKAPQLRTLDLEDTIPVEWSPLLVPTLEDIRISECSDTDVDTLATIFAQCPRLESLEFEACSYDSSYPDDAYFEVFVRPTPIAPALHRLILTVAADDLFRILKAGFPDVVIPTVHGCVSFGYDDTRLDLLAAALLRPDVGPLVLFDMADRRAINLRSSTGCVRRLEVRGEDAMLFQMPEAWELFSREYALHESVREVRIAFGSPMTWESYIDAFERFPPTQVAVLAVQLTYTSYSLKASLDNLKAGEGPRQMRLPGLSRVELFNNDPSDYPSVESIRRVLGRIEPPGRRVEVCVGNKEVKAGGTKEGAFKVLEALLGEDWVLCSHCVRTATVG
ncbi:hypothetical protein C8R46DRAFT_1058185 [Mycena filopes]|nr:hypothetical protein C8R46DRAFT_1058185 [Mycena filopes]